jgi:hypothetical protein
MNLHIEDELMNDGLNFFDQIGLFDVCSECRQKVLFLFSFNKAAETPNSPAALFQLNSLASLKTYQGLSQFMK